MVVLVAVVVVVVRRRGMHGKSVLAQASGRARRDRLDGCLYHAFLGAPDSCCPELAASGDDPEET